MKKQAFILIFTLSLFAGKVAGQCTVSLNSAVGTDNQTVCRNTAITQISYNTSGISGIASSSGFPSGVSASWNGSNPRVTIDGTPSASGTYNYTVTLTGAGGCSATGTIIVKPLPQGSLTANGPFCASGAGQLTWTATAGTGPYTIIYYDGTANQTKTGAVSGTPFDVFTTPVTGNTTYALVSVTDEATSCERTSGFTDGSATITVNALPTVTYSAQPGAGPLCTDVEVTYTTANTMTNYIWGLPGTVNVDYTITAGGTTLDRTTKLKYLTSGSKTVTVNYTNSNGCTAASPTSSTATTINMPQGSLTANGPFCVSGAGQLTWTASSGTGPYTIIYNDGTADRTKTGAVSGTPFNTSVATVTGTTTYTLVSVTDAGSCIRSSGFTGSSATITVNPSPQGSLSANGPFCATGAGQLTWTATAGTGPYTVVYNDGVTDRTKTSAVSGTPFDVFTTPVTGTTTYTLVSVTDETTSCGRSSSFTGSSSAITVNPLPVANAITGITTLCAGTSGEAYAVTINNTGTATYAWSYSGTNANLSSTTGNAITINFLDNATGGTLTVVETITATGCSTTNIQAITVNPLPVANAITGTATLCAGSSGEVYAVTTDNTGTATYAWSYSGTNANLLSTTGPSITINFLSNSTSGSLTVVETITATGCSKSNAQTITVNLLPAANAITGTSALCAGTSGEAYAVTINNTGTATYAWSYSGTNANLSSTTGNAITIDYLNNSTGGTLTVVETITATGCSTTNTQAITVNPLPVANAITGTPILCAGTSGEVYAVTTDNTGTATYAWSYSGTNANLLSTTGPWITINFLNNATSGTLTVVETIAATGCSKSNTKAITVNPMPQGSLTANGPFCATGSGQLTWTATSGTGPYTVVYNDGTSNRTKNGAVSGTPFDVFTTPVTGTTTYTLVSVTDETTSCVRSSSFTGSSSTITVNPLPVANAITGTTTLCAGTSGEAYAVTTNNTGTATYAWSYSGTNSNLSSTTGNAITIDYLNNATGGTLTVVETITATGCSTTNTLAITVNPLPVANAITGTTTLCAGTSGVAYAVTADNTGTATYAWSYSGTNANLLSTTGPAITINFLNNATSGTLTVVETITATGCSTTNTLVITVNPIPVITGMASTVCNGVGFTVTPVNGVNGAVPTGTTYSWLTPSGAGFSGGTAGSGEVNVNGSLTNSTTSPKTATYTVTPLAGTCPGADFLVTITINPTGQVNQPSDQVVCNNTLTTLVTFSTNNTVGTTTYSWTNDQTSIGLASSGSLDNIPAFTAANTGSTPVVATIVVTPTFSYGGTSCSGPTKTFTITVNPTGQVNQPINKVFCNNVLSSVTFVTLNTIGTTVFNWTNDNTSIGLDASGSGDLSFTALNSTTAPITANIAVTPTFTYGGTSCSGPTKAFTITVNPTGQVNQPSSQVVCNNTLTTLVTFGTNNTIGTTTYSWTNDQTSIGLASSGTLDNIAAFTAVNTGTAPVVATIVVTPTFTYSGTSCSGPTKTFTITVNPTGQVNQPSSQVVCNNTLTTLVPFGTNNTIGTTTYSWTNDQTSIGLAASGTLDNIAAFTAVNTGTAPVVATIVVTPTFTYGGTSCSGPTKAFTITVNPTGQVNQPSSQVVCNNTLTTLVTFGTNNTIGTTTYSWTNDQTSIGLASSGTLDNIAAFTAVNTGTAPVVATIVVIPTFTYGGTSCSGPTKNFTITVNPTGQVNQPSSQVVCNNTLTTLVTFGTNNTIGTTTYSWTNDQTSIGLAASGTLDNIAAFTAVNTGTAPVVATIVVTPTFTYGGTSCSGPTKTFTITVNPTGQVNQPSSQVVCNNTLTTLVTFGTNNTIGTTTYSWTNDQTSIGLAASGTLDNIAAFTAVNTGTAPVVATIVVTPTFTYGGTSCSGPTKNFTITVNPTGQVNQPSSQVVCNNTLTTLVTFGTNNTIGTTTYSWTNDQTSIGLAASGTLDNIAAFTAVNTGTAPVVATIVVTPTFTYGGTSCSGPTKTFTITVNPTGQVNQPSGQVVCNNTLTTLVNFGTNNTVGTTTYSWTNDLTSIGLAASGTSNSIPAFTAVNTGTVPVLATIVVTPTFAYGGTSCTGPTKTFTITVNPAPRLTGVSQSVTVCAGTSANINLLGLLAGSTSTVSYDINGIAQTSVSGIIANGSGAAGFSSAGLSAANNGQILRITGILITSSTPSCTQAFTQDMIMSVDPSSVGGTISSAQTICSGTSPADLNLSGNTGYVVKWQKSSDAGFSAPTDIPGTSTTLTSATIGALTSNTYFRAAVKSGVCAETFSSPVLITVNPLPVPNIAGPAAVNVTSTGNVYSTETGMTGYTWIVSAGGNITTGSGTNAITVTWNTPGSKTVRVNYTNGNNCSASSPTIYNVAVNAKPVANNITIIGDPRSGLTLNGSYVYSDADDDIEGTSLFQWYTGISSTGAGSAPIASATSQTYKITDAELGKFIGFSVTPVAQFGAVTGNMATTNVWVGPVENDLPKATAVSIAGSLNVNSVLIGHYTYSDKEGDIEDISTFQWYSSNLLGGPYTAISGETFSTHLIGINEQGRYFKFYVTPIATSGNKIGIEVASTGYGPANSQPYADNVIVSGTATLNSTLTGSFSFHDVDGELQGTSTFRWLRNGTIPISGATNSTYLLTSADEGFTISFEVTPVSLSGFPLSGTPVTSAQTGIVIDPSPLLPVADQLCITGIRKKNEIITGKYHYNFYKSEGTSTFRWLKNNVPIPGATGLNYTLTQSDIDSGQEITFEVTPVSSNFIPKVGAVVKSGSLARIKLAKSSYSLADPPFALIANVTGGVFSGQGVSAGQFSPASADTAGSPHKISYLLNISNVYTTCSQQATDSIYVVPINAYFVGLKSIYCYDERRDTIEVDNVPGSATNLKFTSSNHALIVDSIPPFKIIIDPHRKRPGIIIDTLFFSFKYGGSYFPISKTFEIDSVGPAVIKNLSSGDVFCNNEPLKTLYPSHTGAGGIFTGPMNGSDLDPSKGLGSTFVNFIYTNSRTQCFSSVNVPITIYPAPKVAFLPKDVCIVSNLDTIRFINKSTSADPVASWLWEFFDGGGSSTNGLKEPGYHFKSGGQHVVSLTSTTINNCKVKKDSTIDIGVKPIADFYWKKECYQPNDSIAFFDTTYSTSTILSRSWNFFDGKPPLSGSKVSYPKSASGYLSVKYKVKTNYENCADSITKQVYIRPSISLSTDDYFQNFESGNGGWVKDYVKSNSWSFGTPGKQTIKYAASGVNAWVTNFTKDSTRSESIISPCFDFTDIKRPMISMKLWKRFYRNRDGAALQYKIGDSGSWEYVGTLDDGINWYNSPLIKGRPGGEQLGWTAGTTALDNQDASWVEARHKLDELTGKKNVIFRIAYGSDGNSLDNEGIAFDDIWIGRRTRGVLLEHFTNNSNAASNAATAKVSGFARRDTLDIINIQYHTNFPGSDIYYNDNPGDASARLLFYGLSRAPYSILDGGTRINADLTLNFANTYDYLNSDLDSLDLVRRSLINPGFIVTLNSVISGGGIVTVSGEVKALDAINSENVTLYIVVTEKKNIQGSTTYYNIFRKFIPDAAGISLKKSWAKNETYTLTPKSWAIEKVAIASDIEIIAFIQNNITKEIYQAGSNKKQYIVDIGNEPANNGKGFSLFPNPASDRLTIAFDKLLQEETEIMIYDYKGSVIQTYKAASGQEEFSIDAIGLRNGIYLVRIKSKEFDWGYKKLIISNN